MTTVPRSAVSAVIDCVLTLDLKSATKYLSPTLTVRATRFGRRNRRDAYHDIRLHIGRPNYAEREFVKACQAADETFPVRKIQLKFPPRQRART